MTATTPKEQKTTYIINFKLDPKSTLEKLGELNKIFKDSVVFQLNVNGDTISITSDNGYDRLVATETVKARI